MAIIGISGRVGTGKSWAATYLSAHLESAIIELDLLGHEALNDATIKTKLLDRFGTDIEAESGINRGALGDIVFSDKQALADLNAIVHPTIKHMTLEDLQRQTQAHVLIVGALIREIGLSDSCDVVVVLDADDALIRSAIGDKAKILASQRSRESYRDEGDIIIANTYNDRTKTQLDAFSQAFRLTYR